MVQRHNMYNNVHKGLRGTLGSLLTDAGSAGPTARQQRAIAIRWHQAQALLSAHHRHEDTFIGPHLARLAPVLFAEMERDHQALDAEIQALGVVASELQQCLPSAERSLRFYGQLAAFVGRYFCHLTQEEGPYLRVLHDAYSDLELTAIEAALLASIAPETMDAFCSIMLPAMNPGERLELVEDARRNAPSNDVTSRSL